MRRLLVALLVVAVVLVGLGFYLEWFTISTRNPGGSGETKVDLTIDRDKIKADANGAKDKLRDLGSKASEKLTPSK